MLVGFTHAQKKERVEEREGGVARFLEESSSPSMEQPSVEVKATRRVPGLNNDRFFLFFFPFFKPVLRRGRAVPDGEARRAGFPCGAGLAIRS